MKLARITAFLFAAVSAAPVTWAAGEGGAPMERPPAADISGFTNFKLGGGASPITGSTSPSGSEGEAPQLERCPTPVGTLAVVEPEDFVTQALARYSLPSPSSLIRMMVQQSSCFVVLERGAAFQNMMRERSLQQGGQFQGNANFGGGQMLAADYSLTPSVVFSENAAGGFGLGILGAFVPGIGGAVVSALGAGLNFKEAQTTLILSDNRTGVQIAAAEGSSSKADFRLFGVLGGGSGFGGAGAYGNTNEGKVVAASFIDNYNKIVAVARALPPSSAKLTATASPQAGPVSPASARSAAPAAPRTAPVAASAPISGARYMAASAVVIRERPASSSSTLGRLKSGQVVVATGEFDKGWWEVEADEIVGWILSGNLKEAKR